MLWPNRITHVTLFLVGHKLFDETKQMDVGPWCQIFIKILHYAKK